MAHRQKPPVILTHYQKTSSIDMYMSEVRSIRESRIYQHFEQDENSEEEDLNALFLQQAGFGNVVSELQRQLDSGANSDDSGELDSQTEGLPKSHVRLIKKRVHTLRSTLRSKRGQDGDRSPRGDVRGVFHDSHENSASLPTSAHSSVSASQLPSAGQQNLLSVSSATAPPALPPRMKQNQSTSNLPSRRVPNNLFNNDSGRRGSDVGQRSLGRSSKSSHSPEQEDIKLHFGIGSPVKGLPNGTDDHLPRFTVMPDSLGITHTTDISPTDHDKVRSLALLELTVTFDDHCIPLRLRRPAKVKNVQENQVFGVPLAYLLQQDHKRDPTAQIPLIFSDMIQYLEENGLNDEGILRVPGSATRVNLLIQELEAMFHCGVFSFEGRKVTDVASLLKQFLRDLPVPLLTRQYLPAFASIADIDDLKEQVRTLNLLVLLLPELHQKALKRLMVFCERVISHSEINKMDLTNVAMVIAPNLFASLPSRQSFDDITVAAKMSHVVRLLIRYHDLLWTVPTEMLRQVRYLNECEVKRLNQRNVQKALRQMQDKQQTEGQSSGKKDNERFIIRVNAPLYTRVCMAVNISDGVTAGDIVQKLQKRSRLNKDIIKKRFSSSNLLEPGARAEVGIGLEEDIDAGEQFLYEVGGNIGERCLPHNTNLYALYEVNPRAKWVIKPRDCPDLT